MTEKFSVEVLSAEWVIGNAERGDYFVRQSDYDTLFARLAELEKFRTRTVDYMRWLRDCSDTEMADGDAARAVARRLLPPDDSTVKDSNS